MQKYKKVKYYQNDSEGIFRHDEKHPFLYELAHRTRAVTGICRQRGDGVGMVQRLCNMAFGGKLFGYIGRII